MIDLAAARTFVHTHGRLIDRRRFAVSFEQAPAATLEAAVAAYRNPDGGLGALEPDLRTPTSQPSSVLYGLEFLDEAGTAGDHPLVTGALDWLTTVTASDGSVPFVLPTARDAPSAPWWDPIDAPPSSLLMTAGVAAAALRLGSAHPWVDRAAAFCWERVDGFDGTDAYTLRYVLQFLDATPDRTRAEAALEALAVRLPDGDAIAVQGGIEGERLSPLELVPRPDHAGRRLFDDAVVQRGLDELAEGQHDDGGWMFSWMAWNEAVAWEWRGAVTVAALRTLQAYGRLG
jgi:hypothetical protein